MPRRVYALLLVLFILVPMLNIAMVRGAGTGYLAIKDYLGTVWTMDDVQKIMNYYYTTSDGENKSLADYFWIVVDDDPDNKYNLRNFTASPLDGKTAVLALPAGDHYVDIYWFGYHQRQLVHIVENQHYVLKLETAPVVPFNVVGEPPSNAEWDLASNPEGLTIVRRDGNAYVRFVYNQSHIEVAWYDDNTGWNYQALDIYIDGSYQWGFHIVDPSKHWYNKTYNTEVTILWQTYNVPGAHVNEYVNWSRKGEILHITYMVGVSMYDVPRLINDVFRHVAMPLVSWAIERKFVNPITYMIERYSDFATWVQQSYDNKLSTSTLGYTDTIVLIWDIFTTPTQVIVLAHAYYVDQNGNLVEKSITSANAFTINNRLVYIKQLSGGLSFDVYDNENYQLEQKLAGLSVTINVVPYYKYYVLDDSNHHKIYVKYPYGYNEYYIDDLGKYSYDIWFAINGEAQGYGSSSQLATIYVEASLIIHIYDAAKADAFEQNLMLNNIDYIRDSNKFTFKAYNMKTSTSHVKGEVLIISDFSNITDLIPSHCPGKVEIKYYGYVEAREATGNYNTIYAKIYSVKIHISVTPKMTPPQVSILKDGYQTVSGAFAVQVYSDVFRNDNTYMLGYYLLGNDPPPVYVVNDTYYDPDQDVMYYVKSIISVDAYGQDIVDFKANSTLNEDNETIYNYYLSIKPTVRTLDNVTIALFDYNRMSFLNLAPEIIKYLLLVPPGGGYGVPIIDWSTVSVMTLNTSRPYELYYWANGEGWVKTSIEYDNTTMTYSIYREDNHVLVEQLNVNKTSSYLYKIVYTDNGEKLQGYLLNYNGILKIITGEIRWSIPKDFLDKIIDKTNPDYLYEQWASQWNEIARKLGLITDILNKIGGAWDWLNQNWKWIALGFGLLLVLIIVLIAGVGGRGRVVVLAR